MTNRHFTAAVITIAFVTVFMQSASSGTKRVDREVNPSNTRPPPLEEINSMRWGWACHSILSGAREVCQVEPHTLSQQLSPLILDDCFYLNNGRVGPGACADGGHKHTSSQRPVILSTGPGQQGNKLEFPGDQIPSSIFSVIGPTSTSGWVFSEYKVPEAAGFYHYVARLEPPPSNNGIPRSFIGTGVQPDGAIIYEGAINVGIPKLRQLPDMPSLYRKFRNPDSSHLNKDAFTGREIMLEALELISTVYKQKTTTLLLQPNDISLPLGGVFDLEDGWTAFGSIGHFSHRVGLAVDMNRQPWDTVTGADATPLSRFLCKVDYDFHEAVDKVLKPINTTTITDPTTGQDKKVKTAVHCESGGKKHIDVDFNQLIPYQPPP